MGDIENNSNEQNNTHLSSQLDVFKKQFLESITKYENMIKGLSILKELGTALRSEVFSNRDSFLSHQLQIFQKMASLTSASLIIIENNLKVFEVIGTSQIAEDGKHSVWRPIKSDIRKNVIQKKTHYAVKGQNETNDKLYIPVFNNDEVIAVLCLEGINLSKPDINISFYNLVSDQFATAIVLANMYHRMINEEKQRLQIGRFFSKTVAQKIFSNHGDLHLGGQRLNITTIFADLCGFTAMSEKMDQQEVVDILNEFFSIMTPVIFKHDGTLDKLLGDGIMAFFGAPIPHKDDTLRAVKAAVEMISIARKFREENKEATPINLSIGVTRGDAVVGYLGTNDHLNYTAIGDVVNTAQRLESLADPDTILIGESVFELIEAHQGEINNLHEIIKLPAQSLKGKKKPINAYKLIVE